MPAKLTWIHSCGKFRRFPLRSIIRLVDLSTPSKTPKTNPRGGGVAWTVPCYVTVRLVGNVKMYHRFNVAMMLLAAYLASFIPRCLRALRCPRGCDGSSRW